MKDFVDNAVKKVEEGTTAIASSYEKHIRTKAIKEVEKKLAQEAVPLEEVSDEDFEAMVNDACKEIKTNYSKRASQGLLAFIGLDFLLG